MKIKFNWGTGIVIAFLIMISAMIYLVSIAVRQNDDLVDNDYYQRSITYQEHIEKVKNNEALAEKIKFDQSPGILKLTFPALAANPEYSGDIHFYSPVEERRDLTVKIKLSSDYIQIIDLSKLEKGRYRVKIDWKAGKTEYYQEEEIVVGE
jgi:nitrogen fixation protein FixH